MAYYICMSIGETETSYIRAIEAARILNVSHRTIDRWCETGRIKDAHKINPEISNSPLLVAKHEVERLLKLREQGEG
jgi:hypothetical protein